MNRDYFLQLADYTLWVNSIVIGWLNQIDDLHWSQILPSSFTSIQQTTLHLVSAEKIWLDYWQEVANPVFLSTQFVGTKEDLIQLWMQTSATLQAFIHTYPEAKYQQQVRINWRGVAWEMSFWQTFAHFINHATYHRGQVVTLLHQIGFTDLTSTDLATFLRKRQHVESHGSVVNL